MQRILIFFMALMLSSCVDEATPGEMHEVYNASDVQDTIKTEAVRETQFIVNDSGEVMTTDLMTDNLPEPDYRWVPEELDLFAIGIEGEEIVFWSDSVNSVKISSCIESSLTIMDEGKHCDLEQWKHGYTPWEKMTRVDKYVLADLGYTRFKFKTPFDYQSQLPFPTKDMTTLRNQVKNDCGDFWFKHIKNSESPYDYPCGVVISAYLFKVEYIENKSSNKKVAYLKIPVAMGC